MNLALFDFDGTITHGDSWTPFIRLAASPARKVVGYTVLLPVGVGYFARLVPGRSARPLYARVAFTGIEVTRVRDIGHRYASEVLPGTIRPRALQQIAWHKANGDTVAVVSGSLEVYVRPWCEGAGIDCIATQLEEHNGRLTGRYLGGECSGAEKAARVRQQYDLQRYREIFAYGDTVEDREMLALAGRRYYRWQEERSS
jgi:phosphatidylglycerophosphatase C